MPLYAPGAAASSSVRTSALTSDQSFASTTPAAVTSLSTLSLEANARYSVQLDLFASCATSNRFTIWIPVPTGAAIVGAAWGGASGTFGVAHTPSAVELFLTNRDAPSSGISHMVRATITMSSTAGTMSVNVGCTTGGTTVVVATGSVLTLTNL